MRRLRAEWGGIPAYAGMTMREGMTVEGGMETNKRGRGRGPRDRALCATSPSHPRGLVIPAKAGTYWMSPDSSTLSRRVRGVLSPYRERGKCGACAPNGAGFPHRRE